MWDGDTQNRRPNSCLACPHTFSHQHICTCWLLLTFHGNQIYIQKHWFHCHQIHGLGSYVRRQDWIVSICYIAYDLPSCHPLAPFPSSDTNWWHLVPSASRLLSNRGAQLTHQLKNYILCFEDSPSPRRGCGYQLNRSRHPQTIVWQTSYSYKWIENSVLRCFCTRAVFLLAFVGISNSKC